MASILSHIESREITNDYTVCYNSKRYQIDRGDVRVGLRKAKVQVQQGLDGTIHMWINRYQSRRDPQSELRMRLRDLAGSRVRYGYRRLTVLLRREGWTVDTKRVYRLYREEGLQVRTAKRARRASHTRVPLPQPVRAN